MEDKVGELAGDCRELRNCGSQILKVRNGSSELFLVCNSAIDLPVRNIAELRRCGLKFRMRTFACHRKIILHLQLVVTDKNMRINNIFHLLFALAMLKIINTTNSMYVDRRNFRRTLIPNSCFGLKPLHTVLKCP
jgi:hypothetical protein